MNSWWRQALCANEAELYDRAAEGEPAAIRQARALCRRCPGAVGCMAESLGHREPVGVWAGLDPDGREGVLKRRVVPRIPLPDVMELVDPAVALVDRLDDAAAEGLPLGPLVTGTLADVHGGYKKWRRDFNGRLSGGGVAAVSSKLKAS